MNSSFSLLSSGLVTSSCVVLAGVADGVAVCAAAVAVVGVGGMEAMGLDEIVGLAVWAKVVWGSDSKTNAAKTVTSGRNIRYDITKKGLRKQPLQG